MKLASYCRQDERLCAGYCIVKPEALNWSGGGIEGERRLCTRRAQLLPRPHFFHDEDGISPASVLS